MVFRLALLLLVAVLAHCPGPAWARADPPEGGAPSPQSLCILDFERLGDERAWTGSGKASPT
jgi:hypothetical protein